MDQLAAAHERLIVQHRAFSAPLTDEIGRLSGPSFVKAFASVGSASGGVGGRADLGAGFALAGGVAFGEESYRDVAADDEISGALSLRFIPGDGPSRPYLELGGGAAHVGRLTLTRVYMNGAGIAVGQGRTSGDLASAHARLGWIFTIGHDDELAVFGEYAMGRLAVGGYVEPLSRTNPFEAHVAAGGARLQLGRVALRYTHALSQRWDLGLGIGVARDFDVKDGILAAIPGVGLLPPAPSGGSTFVEYDARVQYQVTDRSRAAVFVDGVAGASRIGGAAHFGVEYVRTF